jgi:hypothetical protein
LTSRIVPPCAFAASRTKVRPSPVLFLPVYNNSKI